MDRGVIGAWLGEQGTLLVQAPGIIEFVSERCLSCWLYFNIFSTITSAPSEVSLISVSAINRWLGAPMEAGGPRKEPELQKGEKNTLERELLSGWIFIFSQPLELSLTDNLM